MIEAKAHAKPDANAQPAPEAAADTNPDAKGAAASEVKSKLPATDNAARFVRVALDANSAQES
jgi:hypothetical protein